MKYSTGDTVKFRLKSGEVQEGEVVFIEKRRCGDVLYVNGFQQAGVQGSGKKRSYREFRFFNSCIVW